MLAFKPQGLVMLSPVALSRPKKLEQRARMSARLFPKVARRVGAMSYARYPETPSHNSFKAVRTSNA
jgi:hypothetical protein